MTFETSSLTIEYSFGQASTSQLDVIYSYDEKVASTSSLDIITRTGTEGEQARWGRQVGFWAWTTSEIAGFFPRWHMARHSVRGRTQKFINSWGMNFDIAKREYAKLRKNLFLATAEFEQPDVFYYGTMVNFSRREKVVKNLLFNPAFTLRGPARYNRPVMWNTGGSETTGTVELVRTPTFVGTHAVKMSTSSGETAVLSQEITTPFNSAVPLTVSLWYLCPMSASYLTADEQVASLYFHVIYADGTATYDRAALSLGTAGYWKRTHITIDPEKEVFSIKVGVQVHNDTGSNILVYLGGMQLERNDHPTNWTETPADSITYVTDFLARRQPFVDAYVEDDAVSVTEEVNAGDSITYSSPQRTTLHYAGDYHVMWHDALPMRATTTETSDVPSATQVTKMGWYQTVENEWFDTSWRIVNNKIEQYNTRITNEVVATFDIAEFWLDERGSRDVGIFTSDEDSTFSRTLETLCVYRDKLWVMCKETQGGVTKRILKILNPHSRYPLLAVEEEEIENVHLECMGDVDIGFTTGTVDFLAPSESNPDQMVIRVGETYYIVALEYDYYLVDTRTRQAILRHEYEGQQLVTV